MPRYNISTPGHRYLHVFDYQGTLLEDVTWVDTDRGEASRHSKGLVYGRFSVEDARFPGVKNPSLEDLKARHQVAVNMFQAVREKQAREPFVPDPAWKPIPTGVDVDVTIQLTGAQEYQAAVAAVQKAILEAFQVPADKLRPDSSFLALTEALATLQVDLQEKLREFEDQFDSFAYTAVYD